MKRASPPPPPHRPPSPERAPPPSAGPAPPATPASHGLAARQQACLRAQPRPAPPPPSAPPSCAGRCQTGWRPACAPPPSAWHPPPGPPPRAAPLAGGRFACRSAGAPTRRGPGSLTPPAAPEGPARSARARLRRAPRLRRPLLCWRRRRRLPWQRHCGSERNLVKRRLEPLQQRLARSLHRVAGQLDRGAFAALAAALTVARRRRLRRREEDRDALDDRELALRRLGALAQSAQRGLVVVDGGEGEPPPLREEEREDGGVEVCPAEERVPRGGEHLGLGLGTG
mmetsp:Transcript_31570/g.104237  ORF Transcript_31570/g.104237 Transcript_31570/m.104237 type:complete len:284 (+) Transcript_31570:87-938(+)